MIDAESEVRFEHDIQKPLSTVKMFFDLYRDSGTTVSQIREWEPLITHSLEKVVQLVRSHRNR